MVLSELMLQSSWPTHSYFHSNLDQYDQKMELIYASGLDHHELSSSFTTTTTLENSSSVSSVNYPMLSDDYGHNHDDIPNPLVNLEGVYDVCKWLCDDDHGQGMDELSVYVQNDTMEFDSQTGINNLLMAYAEAMEMEHEELAKVIVKCISEKVKPIGSPLERLAFNLFKSEENQDGNYLEQESLKNYNLAFRAFYDIFPYGRFAHLTACSAIIEAIPTHVESVHIIDSDICEGAQWPPIIEAIARMQKSLIITSIKLDQDQESQFKETKRNLCDFSRSVGLNLKVQEMELAQVVRRMEGSEFVAFNCMVGLPHMGRTRKRAQVMHFLDIAKEVMSKTNGIITFGNGGVDKTSNFSSFFNKSLACYKALYESMEWGFPSYLNEARIAMETLFLAPFVSSISWFQEWEEQSKDLVSEKNFEKRFALKGKRMSNESLNEAREMVKGGETPYTIRVEGDNENEMALEWRGTSLVRVSSWK
ncbi:protein NODULATION SIGNALING PATHWAY 2-like [Rutidosis leptorrhynchoides]|uniref:protein NODULATION SIGNALING PATHWAY 2-like n=1 Tax=Rutidosis leptorrhynchoides TaxID=125765 RepID=UPI003A98D168